MALDAIVGHERPRRMLRRALTGPRRAHAYLFDGPRGVGKMTLAREFAKALLCEAPTPDACDRCRSCSQVARGVHPYFFLFSLPPDKKNISIDSLREDAQLAQKMALKPVGSPHKIVCFDDAETLSPDAAGWLLKLIEEPPPRTVFLLVTAVRRQMPATILSRCQRVRFARLAREETLRVLVERAGLAAADAESALTASPGSPGEALSLRDAGIPNLRDRLQELFEGFAAGRYGGPLDALLRAADFKRAADARLRGRARIVLGALAGEILGAVRDPAAPSVARPWAERAGTERTLDALERVLRAQREIDRNANHQIVFEAVCGALAQAGAPPP